MSNTQFRIGDRIVNPEKGRGVVVGYDCNDGWLFVKWEDDRENSHGGGGRVVDEKGVSIEVHQRLGSWADPMITKLDKESKVLEILRTWHKSRE